MHTKSSIRVTSAFLLLAFALTTSATAGLTANVDGKWNISMSVPTESAGTCVFQGTAQITQNGSEIMGTVNVQRVSGSTEFCPATMQADLVGTAIGTDIEGTLDGGQLFGTAEFFGTVLSNQENQSSIQITLDNAAAPAGPGAPQVGGNTNVTQGPFSGLAATFLATQVAMFEIPTLNDLGIATLAALLLSSTFLVLRRSLI